MMHNTIEVQAPTLVAMAAAAPVLSIEAQTANTIAKLQDDLAEQKLLIQALQQLLEQEKQQRLDQSAKDQVAIDELNRQNKTEQQMFDAMLLNSAEKGIAGRLKLALEGSADPLIKNAAGQTALHLAIINNHFDIADTLLNDGRDYLFMEPDNKGQTPIQQMAADGQMDKLAWLYQRGKQITEFYNSQNAFNDVCAVATDAAKNLILNNKLLEAAKSGDKDWVVYAIQKGADINYSIKNNGNTALHEAINYDHVEIVNYLISHDADPMIHDQYGRTALELATLKNKSIMPLTSQNIAQDKIVMPVADIASSFLIFSSLRGSCDGINQAFLSGAKLLAVDSKGETALHKAVRGDDRHTIKLLLQKYAEAKEEISVIKYGLPVPTPLALAKSLNKKIETKSNGLQSTSDYMLFKFGGLKRQQKIAEKSAIMSQQQGQSVNVSESVPDVKQYKS